MTMKNIFIILLVLGLYASCTIDEQIDPNAPSLNSVETDASITELNLLVTGIESSMRNGYGTYVDGSGSIAREMYKFDADPRNTEDLLGKEGTALDNNTFYLTAPYNSRYRAIKNANILLGALENTSSVTDQEKNGYRGYANTIKALMYAQVLNMLDDNGIRFDVADPVNLGPFIDKSTAYTQISGLLSEARTQLSNGVFIFSLSAGFAGFDTPSTFSQFNSAVAARLATNQGDFSEAKSHLPGSFMDKGGDISIGPKHIFSTGSGDQTNPLYKVPGENGDQLVVHNDVIASIESGDDRISKFRLRANPTSLDGLNGTHEIALYSSVESSIDIIRNEELILISAEANINTDDLAGAVSDLNIIRTAHGLADYSGAMTKEALIDEMLHQRRYSLWGEGHRMWDLRRYGRLNDQFVPVDRSGDIIHVKFPIPLTENQ
jgi:hypothetical protein